MFGTLIKKEMFKAVLFDMDGVIVDTEPLHRKAYFKMFKAINIEVSDDLYESFTGQSTLAICVQLCQLFKLTEPPTTLVQLKRDFFKELFFNDDSLTLIEGVLDRIKEYHQKGMTLVLASSASMLTIDNVFKRFKLDSYFVAKLSGADLRASKPHPEIFIKAAKASGYDQKHCVIIEDSTNGIAAANAAGIYCIGFKSPHSKNQDYTKASKIITDFSEISYHKLQALKNK